MAIQVDDRIIQALLARRTPENHWSESLMEPFLWDRGGAKRKPGARDSKITDRLLAQGTDSSPVGHWTQGAARVMSAIAGVKRERDLIGAEQQAQLERERFMQRVYGPQGTPDTQPDVTAPTQPQTPFVTPPGSVKPEQSFTPPATPQANPFGIAPGSVKPEQPFTPTAMTMPTSDNVPAGELNQYQQALLNTIAGPESAGAWNVMYSPGPRRYFQSYADHPRSPAVIARGPNAGRTSDAAGKFQFLSSTWDAYKNKLGLTDFSPENQQRAAWALAVDDYKRRSGGRDLMADLQSGDPRLIASVGRNLSGTWTSLPGGIEQGIGQDAFVSAFMRNLSGSNQQRTPAMDRIVQALMAGTPRAMNLSGEERPAPFGMNMQPQAPEAPQADMPQQPFQVAALGNVEAPNAAPPMQPQGEQFAQAPQMQPFTMDDVNAAVPFLNQRPAQAPAPVQAPQRQAQPQAQPNAQAPIPQDIIRGLAHPDPVIRASAAEWIKRQQPQIEIKTGQDGSIIAVDKRTLKAWPIYEAPKSQWGVIGKDRYGREQFGFINPNAKTVEQYNPQGDLGPTDEQTAKLRNEIRQLPSYKAMSEVGPRYQAMTKAAQNDNRAADLSLVYGFMKILDPTSVVRESEADMAQNIATVPQKYRAQVESFLNGTGRLAPQVRAEMMKEAYGAAQSYRQAWENDLRLYRGIIGRQKMNADDVFVDFEPFSEFVPQAAPPPNADPSLNEIDAEIQRRRGGR